MKINFIHSSSHYKLQRQEIILIIINKLLICVLSIELNKYSKFIFVIQIKKLDERIWQLYYIYFVHIILFIILK